MAFHRGCKPCKESLALRREYSCDRVCWWASAVQPSSCGALLKKSNMDARALLKIFGCSAAKCLISSWFGNQIHVHLVLRGQVCEKKGSRFTEEKQLRLKTRDLIGGFRPIRMVVLIPVAFLWLWWGKPEKTTFFVRSPKLPFLMTSVRSIRSVRKFFGFSAATVLHSLSVCLCKLNLPLLMAGRNGPTQQYSRKVTLLKQEAVYKELNKSNEMSFNGFLWNPSTRLPTFPLVL